MKQIEFNRLFPIAEADRFKPDYDGTMVYANDDGVLVDIESNAFWNNVDYVTSLHLPPLGMKWWNEKRGDFLTEWRRVYKYRKLDHDDLFPLDYHPKRTSQNWGPIEWDVSKTQKPKMISLVHPQDINIESFRIYVNDKDFFMLRERLPWNLNDVDKIDFDDPKNEYCLSLKAMYVLSYLGGIGLKNLNSENNLAKSLAHFYFYYHLRKMYNYRDFKRYDTEPVQKFPWSLYSWRRSFVWYHPQVKYTTSSLKRNPSDIIEGIHVDGNKVWYNTRLKKRDVSQDYLRLVNDKNKGITRIGQLLLQESCQAYVYCVLGAQAKTRWKIVGDSANSLQTQRVFQDLVGEVTKQNNISVLIKSMRVAISDTKVRLDFCVSPGLELLPSNMVFIKDTPGYNNILIVSTRQQRFGINNNVNTTLKRSVSEVQAASQDPVNTPVSNLRDNLQDYFKDPTSKPTREPTRNLLANLQGSLQDYPQTPGSNTGIVLIGLLLATPILLILL